MKQLSINILLFSFTILISSQSCISNKNYDEEIIKSIFPQIVDSLKINHIRFPPPPPSGDSIKMIDWKNKMELIESQKKLVILVDDTLKTIKIDDFKIKKIIEKTPYLTYNELFKKTNPSQKIDLKKLDSDDNYEFQYLSKYLKPRLTLSELKNKKFGGILSFSRVYINKSNNEGIFKMSYTTSYDSGQGFIITIKKVKNEWRITKFHFDWVT